jgi:hypothetical protein
MPGKQVIRTASSVGHISGLREPIMEDLKKYRNAATRMRLIQLAVWGAFIIVQLAFAYCLVPYIDQRQTFRESERSPEYKRAVDETMKKSQGELFRNGSTQGSWAPPEVYYAGPLVEVRWYLYVNFPPGEKPFIMQPIESIRLRYDRIVLWAGFSIVLALTIITMLRSFSNTRVDLKEIVTVETSVPVEQSARPEEIVSRMEAQVAAADVRAESLFGRSTLLLGGGIIMAFVGVSIFYLTLPEVAGQLQLDSYLAHSVRSVGVLIFLESIAWFLLRQYRTLVEDYKWFHRLYLKRANFLVAFGVLDKKEVRPEDIFLAASLLQEDLSGKLQKDETTEANERLRVPDDNPVVEILRTIVSIHGRKNEVAENRPPPA